MQIWHRDVQPGIVQSSNQIISRDRHNSNDISAFKITNPFYYIKVRRLGWPLNGGYILLLQPCHSLTRRVGRIIVILKHEWMIPVTNYVFKELFWQRSDIIVRTHVFIDNDQIANTVASTPHPIPTNPLPTPPPTAPFPNQRPIPPHHPQPPTHPPRPKHTHTHHYHYRNDSISIDHA